MFITRSEPACSTASKKCMALSTKELVSLADRYWELQNNLDFGFLCIYPLVTLRF